MSSRAKPRRILRRVILRSLKIIVICALVFVLYLRFVGFPSWLVARLNSWVNASNRTVAIEARGMKLHMFRGLEFIGARLYRKRMVGPPAMEAESMIVGMDPFFFIKGTAPIKKVKISDALIRTRTLFGAPREEHKPPGVPMRVELEMINCRVDGVDIRDMKCTLTGTDTGSRMERLESVLTQGAYEGQISGNMEFIDKQESATGHFEARLDPHLIIPLLEANDMSFTPRLIRRFKFGPDVPKMDITCDFRPDDSMMMAADFSFQDGSYRDVDTMHVDGSMHVFRSQAGITAGVDRILIVRPEGNARGSFSFDDRKGTIEFQGTSTIDPPAVMKMIGAFTNVPATNWVYESPVSMEAGGRADVNGCAKNDLSVRVIGRGLGYKSIVTDECDFTARVKGNTNKVETIRAKMFGGDLQASVVSINTEPCPADNSPGQSSYDVSFALEGADFGKVAKAISMGEDDYKGEFALRMHAKGLFGDRESITGKGNIRIKHGKVFMLPIFGGLSKTLAKIIPGLGFVMRQSDAKADFVIEDGKIKSDNIEIQGGILSLAGKGEYSLSGELDFVIQIKLLKDDRVFTDAVVRFITWPISKILEFRLRGTAKDPKWTPFSSTVSVFKSLGGDKKDKKD